MQALPADLGEVFVSYPGAKGQAGVFQRIIGQMPPHDIYVEAFAGSAKIFTTKKPARFYSILIDQNPACLKPFKGQTDVQTVCDDAVRWLDLVARGWTRPIVLYCDPPYVLSTRQGRLYYDHEMTDDHHAKLLRVLKVLQFPVMLSGYPSELYSSQLQDWRCISYRTRTRGRTLTECLWCNFPEPTELHDWRFAGRTMATPACRKRMARARRELAGVTVPGSVTPSQSQELPGFQVAHEIVPGLGMTTTHWT